jgi:hypothetical protein
VADLVPEPNQRAVARRDMRVSDQDRSIVLDELRVHFAEGRLDLGEFEERVNAVVAARFRGDLTPLLDDLPELNPPKPGPPVRERRPRQSKPLWDSALFRIHTYITLVFAAFFLAIYFGVNLVADGVPFWPIFPISVFATTLGLHAAIRKGAQN